MRFQKRLSIPIIFFCFLCPLIFSNDQQTVSEHITLLPLDVSSNNFIYIKYKQTVKINGNVTSKHLQQFPLGIHQLLSTPHLQSFSASLSQGTWRTSIWGSAPAGESIDQGGSISAIVKTTEWQQRIWPSLTHGLNGLLCSSFGSVTDPNRVMELPINEWFNFDKNETQSRYLSMRLPLEPLCTENITPFMKLLACRFQSGIGRVFRHPMWFAKQPYRTIQLEAFKEENELEFRAVLSVVLHRPTNIQFENFASLKSMNPLLWIDKNIFDNVLEDPEISRCPACDDAKIAIWLPDTRCCPKRLEASEIGARSMVIYDLDPFKNLSGENECLYVSGCCEVAANEDSQQIEMYSSILKLENGTPQSLGARLVLKFVNADREVSRKMHYFGPLPHYISPLLHSVQVEVESPTNKAIYSGLDVFNYVNMSWLFPVDFQKYSLFKFSPILDPESSVTLSFDFRKTFLHVGYFSFSPDRGLMFPGGLLLQEIPERTKSSRAKMFGVWNPNEGSGVKNAKNWLWRYTKSHYIMFALPDLSMPFNVIALTSTALMLFFSSILKSTTTRPSLGGSTSPAAFIFKTVKRFTKTCVYKIP